MTQTSVTAALLVIGDEILSGRTKDQNICYIADYLAKIGIDLREARIVPDTTSEIVAAVDALRARCDYLFTTGGIGPTHDTSPPMRWLPRSASKSRKIRVR
jgi:molybdopterin-biosynthesis enzyme MoeA-like protein